MNKNLVWIPCLTSVVPSDLPGTFLVKIIRPCSSEPEIVSAKRFAGSWIDSSNGSLLRGKVIEYTQTKINRILR